MTLTIWQKSIYLDLFNATMISRSVGKTIKNTKHTIKAFKIQTFKEIQRLVKEMENGRLSNRKIRNSIGRLRKKFSISFGQAQKAINVIVKYHFYLYHSDNDEIRRILDCPLDSVVLKSLKITKTLTKICKQEYLCIQRKIEQRSQNKIDFDTQWDKQKLKKWGLL